MSDDFTWLVRTFDREEGQREIENWRSKFEGDPGDLRLRKRIDPKTGAITLLLRSPGPRSENTLHGWKEVNEDSDLGYWTVVL